MRFAVLVLVASLATLTSPSFAQAELVEPRSARAFVDSIGVNTHHNYFDTAYADWPRVVANLEELGVTKLRDHLIAGPGLSQGWRNRAYGNLELAASKGMRFNYVMARPDDTSQSIDAAIAVLRDRLGDTADAIEGPNEYDNYKLPRWSTALRAYQRELYLKVKAEPKTSALPVIGPSVVIGTNRPILGDLRPWLDRGNIHPYSGGRAPGQAYLQKDLASNAAVSGTAPVWATEAGFHNAVASKSGHAGVSEEVAATYLLRTYLEHFAAGIERTYAYEAIDVRPDATGAAEQSNFGLLRDDFTQKPAFLALKNLLSSVKAGQPDIALKPIDVKLGGETTGVKSLLLQKSTTEYTLVLWQSASVWDTATRSEVPVESRRVTLEVPQVTDLRISRPALSAKVINASLQAREGVRSSAIDVPADPILIDLSTGAAPQPERDVRPQSPGDPGPETPVASEPKPDPATTVPSVPDALPHPQTPVVPTPAMLSIPAPSVEPTARAAPVLPPAVAPAPPPKVFGSTDGGTIRTIVSPTDCGVAGFTAGGDDALTMQVRRQLGRRVKLRHGKRRSVAATLRLCTPHAFRVTAKVYAVAAGGKRTLVAHGTAHLRARRSGQVVARWNRTAQTGTGSFVLEVALVRRGRKAVKAAIAAR